MRCRPHLIALLTAVFVIVTGALDASTAAQAAEPKSEEELQAEREEMAHAHVTIAKKLKTEGKHAEAAAQLEKAYNLVPHPALLWNMASLYEEAEKWSSAKARYLDFMNEPGVPPDRVEAARTKMRALDLKIGAEKLAERKREAAKEAERQRVANLTIKQKAKRKVSKQGVFGWIGVGLGAAAVATGITMHFLAESDRAEVQDLALDGGIITAMTQKEAMQIQENANSMDTTGAVILSIGGALVLAGVIMVATAPRASAQPAPTAEPEVSLSAGASQGGGMVLLTGRF